MFGSIASIFIHLDELFVSNDEGVSSLVSNDSNYNYNNSSNSYNSKNSYNSSSDYNSNYKYNSNSKYNSSYDNNENATLSDRIKDFLNSFLNNNDK